MAVSKVSLTLAEKVGLPNYSNVDIGPVTIEREVEDTPEARAKALLAINGELQEILAQLRRTTLEAIKAFAQAGGYGDVKHS